MAIAASAFLTPSQAHAELKVAVIEMQKIFKEFNKTKEADISIKEEQNGYKKQRDERMESYRKLAEQIKGLRDEAMDPSLSDAAKDDKNKAYEEKVNEARQLEREIREFDQTTVKLLRDQSTRMRDQILKEIQAEIDTFAKGKYSIVLDKSGMTLNGTSTVVYTEGLTDLTDELIKRLNAKK
ncbi:MAG: OmpH family outer membrane protein [Verrucomicrobiota bacterium]